MTKADIATVYALQWGSGAIEDEGKEVEFATPPSVHIDHLDSNHDDAPL